MLAPRELLITQTDTALTGCESNFLYLTGTAYDDSFLFPPAGDIDVGSEMNNWSLSVEGGAVEVAAPEVRAASAISFRLAVTIVWLSRAEP
jgi:hypothetical protein